MFAQVRPLALNLTRACDLRLDEASGTSSRACKRTAELANPASTRSRPYTHSAVGRVDRTPTCAVSHPPSSRYVQARGPEPRALSPAPGLPAAGMCCCWYIWTRLADFESQMLLASCRHRRRADHRGLRSGAYPSISKYVHLTAARFAHAEGSGAVQCSPASRFAYSPVPRLRVRRHAFACAVAVGPSPVRPYVRTLSLPARYERGRDVGMWRTSCECGPVWRVSRYVIRDPRLLTLMTSRRLCMRASCTRHESRNEVRPGVAR